MSQVVDLGKYSFTLFSPLLFLEKKAGVSRYQAFGELKKKPSLPQSTEMEGNLLFTKEQSMGGVDENGIIYMTYKYTLSFWDNCNTFGKILAQGKMGTEPQIEDFCMV